MTCGRVWHGLLLSHALLLCLLNEGDDIRGPDESTRLEQTSHCRGIHSIWPKGLASLVLELCWTFPAVSLVEWRGNGHM